MSQASGRGEKGDREPGVGPPLPAKRPVQEDAQLRANRPLT